MQRIYRDEDLSSFFTSDDANDGEGEEDEDDDKVEEEETEVRKDDSTPIGGEDVDTGKETLCVQEEDRNAQETAAAAAVDAVADELEAAGLGGAGGDLATTEMKDEAPTEANKTDIGEERTDVSPTEGSSPEGTGGGGGVAANVAMTDAGPPKRTEKPELHEVVKAPHSRMIRRKWVVEDRTNVDDFNETTRPNMVVQFPFELDDFQKRAVRRLEAGESVFVAAHTSAGRWTRVREPCCAELLK
eukprot:GHVU01222752.1.p2 GENE.GHVU01222752.1~~GHVU01222752.1.p2  ORF type:complete len:244 (+),score=72.55 GHVU01222752.1:2218-2949(+)